MKKFIYLVQGKAENLYKFDFYNSQSSDLIKLSWDKEIEGAIFYPNSTWATGRNKLLSLAIENSKYDYFIFLDEDVEYVLGSKDLFELKLLQYKPLVASPVQYKSRRLQGLFDKFKIRRKDFQYQYHIDEQMQAFSFDAIFTNKLIPYIEKYDDSCWWYNTEILQYILRKNHRTKVLQFNYIEINNEQHINYPKAYDYVEANKIISFEVGSKLYREKLVLVGMGKCNWIYRKIIILYHLFNELIFYNFLSKK